LQCRGLNPGLCTCCVSILLLSYTPSHFSGNFFCVCFICFSFFFFFEVGFCYVAQAGLKLMILLPQSPRCWDYKCVPLYLSPVFSF
jgi:hypothetical protein